MLEGEEERAAVAEAVAGSCQRAVWVGLPAQDQMVSYVWMRKVVQERGCEGQNPVRLSQEQMDLSTSQPSFFGDNDLQAGV